MSHTRDLFGGAITVSLPSTLIDASDLRQVPDTQEVFLDPDSDVSWVIEILEQVDKTELADAAKFHFDSLAHDNDAENSVVHEVLSTQGPKPPSPPNQPLPTLLTGTQLVRKFNRQQPDDVRIALALFRVDGKSTDVVMTMNFPTRLESTGPVPGAERGWEYWKVVFTAAVQSFRVVDFELFAGGSA